MLPYEGITAEPVRATTAPKTAAESGATLNGVGWLSDLLKTGVQGYVAVQTVKAQNRTPGAVTTEATPRIESAPASGVAGMTAKTWWIVGGLAAALLVLLMLRRK